MSSWKQHWSVSISWMPDDDAYMARIFTKKDADPHCTQRFHTAFGSSPFEALAEALIVGCLVDETEAEMNADSGDGESNG